MLNPKHVLESKNTSQNPKQVPESKTHPRIWILESVFEFWEMFWILGSFLDSGKCFWILESVFEFWEVFWILGSFFGILGSVLDSGKCFWILESVFEFWEVFLNSGKCFWILGSVFGFWEVFRNLGSVLSFRATVQCDCISENYLENSELNRCTVKRIWNPDFTFGYWSSCFCPMLSSGHFA